MIAIILCCTKSGNQHNAHWKSTDKVVWMVRLKGPSFHRKGTSKVTGNKLKLWGHCADPPMFALAHGIKLPKWFCQVIKLALVHAQRSLFVALLVASCPSMKLGLRVCYTWGEFCVLLYSCLVITTEFSEVTSLQCHSALQICLTEYAILKRKRIGVIKVWYITAISIRHYHWHCWEDALCTRSKTEGTASAS